MNTQEQYIEDLGKAERSAQKATDALYGADRLKRGYWHRRRLLNAQNALMSLYVKELARQNKNKPKDGPRPITASPMKKTY